MSKVIGSTWYNETYFTEGTDHVHRNIHNSVKEIEGCDLVILWGGEDISTSIYGEKPGKHCYKGTPSKRDLFELDVLKACQDAKIPVLGVCRGMQLMVAANGGKLWQHVDGHGSGTHCIRMNDGQILLSNSIHHQMVRPTADMEVLATAANVRSPLKWDESGSHVARYPEPEMVFIPGVGLGVQGHPEYSTKKSDLTLKTVELINKYFNIQL